MKPVKPSSKILLLTVPRRTGTHINQTTLNFMLKCQAVVFEIPYNVFIYMTHEPVRGMLVLIAYAQKTLINAYADVHVASSARGLHFGLSLHRSPFFLLARSEGSGESRHMRRLVRIFVAQKRVKNKN